MDQAGISLSTTERAPMTAPSRITTFGCTKHSAAIHTWSSITIGPVTSGRDKECTSCEPAHRKERWLTATLEPRVIGPML